MNPAHRQSVYRFRLPIVCATLLGLLLIYLAGFTDSESHRLSRFLSDTRLAFGLPVR